MEPDYQSLGHESIARADDLVEFLRAHDGTPIRILGLGTQQRSLPAPTRSPRLIKLDGMRKIVRLEAEDLTCTVEPGLSRSDLDRALDEVGVQLPCAGSDGSIGGLFAGGGCNPAAPGAPSPRTLLLGMECLLADGLAFKAGARVVKNVAGYDLPKLFVGSRGKLFIATLLHLKLRPAPRYRRFFRSDDLDQDQALALHTELRHCTPAPSAIHFHRTGGKFMVEGRMDGRSKNSAQTPCVEGLREVDSLQYARLMVEGSSREVVVGHIRPSKLGNLCELLPAESDLTCNGSGQFEVKLSADESDAVLLRIPQLDGAAEIRVASAERRGRATATDRGHDHISEGLKQALDPRGILQ